jgi:chromosome segregation ATPase
VDEGWGVRGYVTLWHHLTSYDIIHLRLQKAGKYAKNVEKQRAKVTEAESKVDVTDGEETALNKQLQDLTEEANAAVETKRQLEDEVKALTAPVKGKEQERKLLARELAQEQKKHKSAVRRLDQARKQILESQGNVAEEERTRTRKIQTTEADIASSKEKVDPLKAKVAEHLHNYQDIAPAVNQMKETREGTEKQVHAVQQKIKAMQAEGGEGRAALTVFGSKCTKMYDVSV